MGQTETKIAAVSLRNSVSATPGILITLVITVAFFNFLSPANPVWSLCVSFLSLSLLFFLVPRCGFISKSFKRVAVDASQFVLLFALFVLLPSFSSLLISAICFIVYSIGKNHLLTQVNPNGLTRDQLFGILGIRQPTFVIKDHTTTNFLLFLLAFCLLGAEVAWFAQSSTASKFLRTLVIFAVLFINVRQIMEVFGTRR